MVVYVLGKEKTRATKATLIKSQVPGELDSLAKGTAKDVSRFDSFWDLMDAIEVHGYLRAAMSVIGRATVGTWWKLVKHNDVSSGTHRQYKRLIQFYSSPDKAWDNIKDYQNFVYKLMIGAMYLRYFGRAAFQIVRNKEGVATGLDFLPGYVIPNVDEKGYFKSPAFIQYPTRNPRQKVEFTDPKDIVYIVNPDWEGFPAGGTDTEALSNFAIPLDMYLQIAAREYMKNRDKPEAFYILPSDISDDAFDNFVKSLEQRYAGPANIGKSPIAIQGELDIKELSRLPSDLPYQEARQDTRQELLAVSGVAGAKLGITDSLSAANLREARREFHETTMRPLFKLMEAAFYEQVHVRELQIPGWELIFNSPDFLTAVEKATVDMRYHDMGVLNPNEIRHDLGKAARKDPAGDLYADAAWKPIKEPSGDPSAVGNKPGSPPEGNPKEPDSPSNTGEPTLDNQDPPRGDQHDENPKSISAEIRLWRAFAVKRFKRGKGGREFQSTVIPDYLKTAIQDCLNEIDTVEKVKELFGEIENLLEER